MDDLALEVVHALPFGRVAFGVAVIALAHPQEIGGDAEGLAVSVRVPSMVHRLSLLDQLARRDLVAVADVRAEIVLVDHLAHIFEDLVGAWRSARRPRA